MKSLKNRPVLLAVLASGLSALSLFAFRSRVAQAWSPWGADHNTPAQTTVSEKTTEPPGFLPSFTSAVDRASPAVVHVQVVAVSPASGPPGFGDNGPFGEQSPFPGFRFPPHNGGSFVQRGTGSGFIIRKDGIVLTNNHVVQNAREITVKLGDGRELAARVIGRDPKTDLALLQIEGAENFPVAALGDSDQLKVGDWVLAIGNPFGLSNTVTAGIVSAKARSVGAGPYDDFIQTDASINPGNSGGPLLDEQGRVVGINTMIFSQSGGNIGIGFAIPINLARQLVPQLEESGHVTRGWLGVTVQPLTPDLSAALGTEEQQGALVAEVAPNSPAAEAGFRVGDVITSYDGKKVDESHQLPMLVASTPIGSTVPVAVVRKGDEKTLDAKIAKLRDDVAAESPSPKQGKWGLALRDLTPAERRQLGLDDGVGVLVAGVTPGSPAYDAEVHSGDVVLQVNRKPVGTAREMEAEVQHAPEGKPLLLLVHPADGNDHFAALAAR
jgi:serine protease Do